MSGSGAGQGRFNALVVEDSPPMRKMIVFALSRIRELSVTEADDGVDALRRIAATKFDIIITDINMPILDGLKLVKRLRADEAYKEVPNHHHHDRRTPKRIASARWPWAPTRTSPSQSRRRRSSSSCVRPWG